MTYITCFDNTTLDKLKKKFLTEAENKTIEQQQEIAISLILERYEQLHKLLNTLRKSSKLPIIQLEPIESIIKIREKSNVMRKNLEQELTEYEKEMHTLKTQEAELAKKEELEQLSNSEKEFKTITIKIGDRTIQAEVANSEEEHEQGLSNRKYLSENHGMLFIFDTQETRGFWMKDTLIPLDIIFIDDELTVTEVYEGIPEDIQILEGECIYVLELNKNSGVKIGDELDFEPKNKQIKKTDKMLVLDSGGEVQMELDGGERIFSRKHTKTLIQFAKKAATTDNDNDYKALGKRMFKFLQVQSETEPEYVESKG